MEEGSQPESPLTATDFLEFLGPDTSATVFTTPPTSHAHPASQAHGAPSSSPTSSARPGACGPARRWPPSQTSRCAAAPASARTKTMTWQGPAPMPRRTRGSPETTTECTRTIENTLEPVDRVETRPSYWSSGGHRDPAAPECLIYKLQVDLCLVDEVKVQPFKAFFQYGEPIYSPSCIRFRMGYPRSPLRPETLVGDDNEGQLIDDTNYVWTYTSPEFPMLQENVLQSFKLPRPVLCIGGVVKLELLGRVQKQAIDGLYYICVSHVQIVGKPLSRDLVVAPRGKGVVLTYYPDPHRCGLPCSDSSSTGDDARSRWQGFAARFWRSSGMAWGNQGLLSRLFGAPLRVRDEDDVFEEVVLVLVSLSSPSVFIGFVLEQKRHSYCYL